MQHEIDELGHKARRFLLGLPTQLVGFAVLLGAGGFVRHDM